MALRAVVFDYGMVLTGQPNAAARAELLRINKERGAIAAGQFADIVAMPGNPLQDVESLRKINFVMKNGKVVRSAK